VTKTEFLDRLRQGLRGIPRSAGEDIMADYKGHFADGLAAGRSEQEIAAALGDPGRLARELRASAGIKQWEEKRNPSSAVTAVFAILGLGAIDILVLLPILFILGIMAFVFYIAIIAVTFAGFGVLLVSFVTFTPGDIAPHGIKGALEGLELIAFGISWGALHTLICIGIVNAVVWYARLHIKVIQPAVES
jgi:uncharacterized membrane protein